MPLGKEGFEPPGVRSSATRTRLEVEALAASA
jgi:hypothetical protein